jgi:hypothetical protein
MRSNLEGEMSSATPATTALTGYGFVLMAS